MTNARRPIDLVGEVRGEQGNAKYTLQVQKPQVRVIERRELPTLLSEWSNTSRLCKLMGTAILSLRFLVSLSTWTKSWDKRVKPSGIPLAEFVQAEKYEPLKSVEPQMIMIGRKYT